MGERGEGRVVDGTGVIAAFGMGIATSLYGATVWSPSTMAILETADWLQGLATFSSLANCLTLLLASLLTGHLWMQRKKAREAVKALALPSSLVAFALWLVVLLPMGTDPAWQLREWQVPWFSGASAMSGVAIALAMLAWAETAQTSIMPLPRVLALSGVAMALCSIVVGMCSSAFLRVAVIVFFCLESVLLGMVSRQDASQGELEIGEAELPRRASLAFKSLAALLVAAVVATFVAPVTNTVILADVLASSQRYVLSTVSSVVASALLLAFWGVPRRTPSSFNVLLVYSVCLLALVVAAFLFPVLGMPLLVFGSMGFFIIWFVSVEASLGAAREYGLPVGVVYGAVGGVAMLARILADLVAWGIQNAQLQGETKVMAAVFLLVYMATCALFLLYGVLVKRRLNPQGDGASEMPDVSTACIAGGDADGRVDAVEPVWEQVSRAYNLTPREAEVLGMIMRGRNVPAMAEELTLSRNTVQTHVRHVYEQLGVHSRKELIGFVEAFPANH